MERHRMAWLYLRRLVDPADARLRVLHFGPEPHLGRRLRALPNVEYVTADLLREDVDLRLDVTDMAGVPDAAFDVVLAADVLEHVDDDRRAMRELLRITRPDGCVLLPTPVEEDLPVTYEDWSITTPAGRAAAFGQADHVRRYGRDFPELLRAEGWEVVPVPMPLPAEEARRFGVPPEEQRLYLGTRAAPGA
jgi:SAM-dependent methyltransferase